MIVVAIPVAEAKEHPEVFAKKSVGQIADHFDEVIQGLDKKPAIIGHSFGGLLTQILAGRGLSAVSVSFDSAPFRGALPLPYSSLKSANPVLENPANRHRAGYFRFALRSEAPQARRLERAVGWRCRWLGLPYGDQGILVAREFLAAVGGVPPLPLMEDVELVRRIGRRRLVALPAEARSAARRWEREGWCRRSLRNITCLVLYALGVPPRMIVRLYS